MITDERDVKFEQIGVSPFFSMRQIKLGVFAGTATLAYDSDEEDVVVTRIAISESGNCDGDDLYELSPKDVGFGSALWLELERQILELFDEECGYMIRDNAREELGYGHTQMELS